MEEVGLQIKNIRYYKNQPWAFSSSLLFGFFVELNGSDCIKIDIKELTKAVWGLTSIQFQQMILHLVLPGI